MSGGTVIDARLRPGERDRLIDEIRAELPLWLRRAAVPVSSPVDELTDLLRFDAEDIRSVHAAHILLSLEAQQFVHALPLALRHPVPATARPQEIGPAVRGPIDWPATNVLHAGGRSSDYVTRPRRRTFDTPEHRALAWTLSRLESLLSQVKSLVANDTHRDGDTKAMSLSRRLAEVQRATRVARRVTWFGDVPSARPTVAVRNRLAASRNSFVRQALAPLIKRLLTNETNDPDALSQLLCERYFTPSRDSLLYEVLVLIRLDRALSASDVQHVRRKLFSASGVVAEYRLSDGDRIHLRQQTWPVGPDAGSRRTATAHRHDLAAASTRPDILVQRLGQRPDFVALELKASRKPSTIGSGLSQLLGYLHDRPGLFARNPAGWLVPLPFDELRRTDPRDSDPLWIVDADRVADAVASRFAPAPRPSAEEHLPVPT